MIAETSSLHSMTNSINHRFVWSAAAGSIAIAVPSIGEVDPDCVCPDGMNLVGQEDDAVTVNLINDFYGNYVVVDGTRLSNPTCNPLEFPEREIEFQQTHSYSITVSVNAGLDMSLAGPKYANGVQGVIGLTTSATWTGSLSSSATYSSRTRVPQQVVPACLARQHALKHRLRTVVSNANVDDFLYCDDPDTFDPDGPQYDDIIMCYEGFLLGNHVGRDPIVEIEITEDSLGSCVNGRCEQNDDDDGGDDDDGDGGGDDDDDGGGGGDGDCDQPIAIDIWGATPVLVEVRIPSMDGDPDLVMPLDGPLCLPPRPEGAPEPVILVTF